MEGLHLLHHNSKLTFSRARYMHIHAEHRAGNRSVLDLHHSPWTTHFTENIGFCSALIGEKLLNDVIAEPSSVGVLHTQPFSRHLVFSCSLRVVQLKTLPL